MRYYPYLFSIIFFSLLFHASSFGQPLEYKSDLPQDTRLEGKEIYTLYLIGDTGKKERDSVAVVPLVQQVLKDNKPDYHILVLGDNIYPGGKTIFSGGKVLGKQVSVFNTLPKESSVTFIPGNHDYRLALKPFGRMTAKHQANYISRESDKVQYLPNPKDNQYVQVHAFAATPDIKILIINTEWYLNHGWWQWFSRKKREKAYFESIAEEVKSSPKYLIVASHHPFYSIGHHGTEIKLKQDIGGKRYKKMTEQFVKSFEEKPANTEIILASGHDHSLQLIKDTEHDLVQILSGAGSKYSSLFGHDSIDSHELDSLVKSYEAEHNVKVSYGSAQYGYGKLVFKQQPDGALKAEFYLIGTGDGHQNKILWYETL